MNFQPLTEEEIQTQSLAPEGTYQYKVIKSEECISKAGNDYIKLVIKIWNENVNETLVFTNLALIKLLKHFCDVNHMQGEYASGNIPASSCMNKSGGMVIIGIEGEKPNENGGMYKSKNIVKDFISPAQGSTMKPLPETKSDFINDEIPF